MLGFLKSKFTFLEKIPNWFLFAVIFIVVEFLIWPLGNYPLNDDWAYAKAISDYLKSNKIIYSDEIAIPFLPQFIVGIYISKIIGFSFFKLRLISLIFSCLTIYIVSKIAELLELNQKQKIIFHLLLIFNPLYLTLQNTFLPEIFILFFAVCAVYCMLLYLNQGQIKHYIWFVIVCVLGVMSRQSSFLIPFIFGLIYLYYFGISFKRILIAIIPFVISIFSLILFQSIAQKSGFLPSNYNIQINALIRNIKNEPFQLFISTSFYFITSLICLGLFIFPIVIFNLNSIIQLVKNSLTYQITLFIVFFILCIKVVLSGHSFPFVGNIFYSRGIGPIILTGFNSDTFNESNSLILIGLKILSFIGGISFYAFMIVVISNFKSFSEKLKLFYFFTFLLLISYLTLISLNYANDRYLLFLLPFLLLIVIQNFQLKLKLLIPMLSFLILFSIMFVSTYFRINDAKWNALDYLVTNKHVSPKRIDGGYEFNSFHNEYLVQVNNINKERWWWIIDDQYIISPFNNRKNYTIESEFKIKSSFFIPYSTIKILKREN